MREETLSIENKRFVIQLCNTEFLNNFEEDLLNNIELVKWERKLGSKDRLHLTKAGCCSAIIVDSDLSYSKQNILAWTRVLIPNGLLILEAVDYGTPEALELSYSEVLEYTPNHNKKIWIFRKKKSMSSIEINNEVIKIYQDKLSNNDKLTALAKLEQIDSQFAGLTTLTIARLMIYTNLGLKQLAIDTLQNFIDVHPTDSYHINTILNAICYSEDFYQKGFKLRQLLIDKFGTKFRTSYPPKEEHSNKRWKGQYLKDKTIVIWTEFGLGDEIMFSQLAYYFKTQGAKKIILIAQEPVIDILRTSLDIDEVISTNRIYQELQDFDYWTYPHDILAYISTPFSKLRRRSPYLFPNKSLIEQYRHLFPIKQKLRIGIVWRGNSSHENDAFRSIHDLQNIESLFRMSNIDWFCFQKQCNEDEIRLLEKYKIPHITKDFDNLAQTAAAMEHINYFITVDTSTAHIAGAIGIPTLLLLPYTVDWRWGFETRNNLWYQNMCSFRCNKPAPDWSDVIKELKQYLDTLEDKHKEN